MEDLRTVLPKTVYIEYDCHIISKYLVFQMKNLFQSKPLVVFVCCKCFGLDCNYETKYGIKKIAIQILIMLL